MRWLPINQFADHHVSIHQYESTDGLTTFSAAHRLFDLVDYLLFLSGNDQPGIQRHGLSLGIENFERLECDLTDIAKCLTRTRIYQKGAALAVSTMGEGNARQARQRFFWDGTLGAKTARMCLCWSDALSDDEIDFLCSIKSKSALVPEKRKRLHEIIKKVSEYIITCSPQRGT